MTTEIRPVRLPVRLSNLVDEAVGRFLRLHGNERLQAYRRYHGADLWMVYAHEPVGETEPAFLTRRVTVGAYSNDPDRLCVISDIVVTRPSGRFTLEYDSSGDGFHDHLESISVLQARLVADPERVSRELLDEHYLGSVAIALEHAWYTAKKFGPQQATQPIS